MKISGTPPVIVSDTSCLILFYKIGELELLQKIYGQMLNRDRLFQPVPAIEISTTLQSQKSLQTAAPLKSQISGVQV